MKVIAIILVMVGVGMAAAFGARNVDAVMERQQLTGRANLLEGLDKPLKKELADAATTAARRAVIETERARLGEVLAPAKEAVAAIPKEAVPARDRLSGWFEHNGLPFAAGVLLIAAGGLLARREDRRRAALMQPDGKGGSRPAVDFGAKLETTAHAVRTLHDIMAGTAHRSVAALEPLKAQVEVISREDIDLLVETRAQVINRYGMSGFAAIFGPLSGAERSLNRAWVAMVDRHWDEAQTSLRIAAERLDETRAQVMRLAKTSA